MSVPSALKLRERRGKKKVVPTPKLVLPLEQWAAIQLGLESLIWSPLAKRPGVLEAAQAAQDAVKRVLGSVKSIDDPNGTRFFESTPDKQARKYACPRCAFTRVAHPDELCPSCSAPGAA